MHIHFPTITIVQVRASAALELEQVVNEVKRQVEKEKEIAIIETKKKKWVSVLELAGYSVILIIAHYTDSSQYI